MGFPSSNSTVISSPDFPDVANITYPAKRVTLLVVIGVVKFVVVVVVVAVAVVVALDLSLLVLC